VTSEATDPQGERRVVDWIADDGSREVSVGGLGGWFKDGDRWEDYITQCDPHLRPYIEAIKVSVLASGRFICGNEHQDSDDGTPLFDDGTVGGFSFRAWGDLMAAIATLYDGQDHHYMEFYYG
jgi:hypothetical protein